MSETTTRATKTAEPETAQDNTQLIRETAYHKWEKAGRPEGDGVSFWLEAETEVAKGGKTALKEDA
jgi:hypothetical protein